MYDRPVQAADFFLRQETGNLAVDAFRFKAIEPAGDGRSAVSMTGWDDTVYHVTVEARRFDQPVYKTCSSEQPAPVEHYYLIDINV